MYQQGEVGPAAKRWCTRAPWPTIQLHPPNLQRVAKIFLTHNLHQHGHISQQQEHNYICYFMYNEVVGALLSYFPVGKCCVSELH